MNSENLNPDHEPLRRLARLNRYVVLHSDMKAGLSGIQQCVERSGFLREPEGCMLLAEGGMGKTTICHMLKHKFTGATYEQDGLEIDEVPVIYSSVPANARIISVAGGMLRELGMRPSRGTAVDVTDQLITVLKRCRTRLIILDELHHLLDTAENNTKKGNTLVCDWLKTLVNETGIAMCLVGTPACSIVIDRDIQLSRRFKHRYPLPRLTAGTPEAPGSLEPFLKAVCAGYTDRLALARMEAFDTHLNALRFFVATGGNIDYICTLLREAILLALQSSQEQITIAHVAAAWDTGLCAKVSLASENPFLQPMAKVVRWIR